MLVTPHAIKILFHNFFFIDYHIRCCDFVNMGIDIVYFATQTSELFNYFDRYQINIFSLEIRDRKKELKTSIFFFF